MPPLSQFTKCDLINDEPHYINLSKKIAYPVLMGKKGAIYYNALNSKNTIQKNYLDEKCKYISTPRFNEKIQMLRSTIKAKGLKKKRKKKRNSTTKKKTKKNN